MLYQLTYRASRRDLLPSTYRHLHGGSKITKKPSSRYLPSKFAIGRPSLALLIKLASISALSLSGLELRPRTVVVRPSALEVTIYELAHPRELVELWMGGGQGPPRVGPDPFGVVLWPGAHLAARLLDASRDGLRGSSVVALGAGTGLVR